MNHAGYGVGAALVLLTAASFGVAAFALRACWLRDWTGAPARLAEAVLWVGGLMVVNELLGAIHLLYAAVEAGVSAAVGVAALAYLRTDRPSGPREVVQPPSREPFALPVALAASAVVAADWAVRARLALRHGMPNVDTLWYHMPFSARFAQDGSVYALSQTQPDPLTPFYPANSELLHAVGILLLGHDTMSPALNLAWLALALLAGWCIGRPFGAPAGTLLAVAVVVGSLLMSSTQPGDASNDIVGLALFLAAVALVVNARGDFGALALAAVPAGLALGTKVSLLAPVLALFAALVLLGGAGLRRRLAASWLVAMPIAGGLWYVRNLVATGNPLPWLKLGIGGAALPATYASPSLQAPVNGFRSTLAHLITQPGGGHVIRSGLRYDLGPAWWAAIAVAVLGLVAAGVSRRDPVRRALGIAGLVAAAAYLVTPESGSSFIVNVRHATPALALGLCLVPLLPRLATSARRLACMGLLAVLFVVTQTSAGLRPPGQHRAWLVVAIAVLAAGALAGPVWRRAPRRAIAALAVLLALGGAAAGSVVQTHYLRHRYADPGSRLLSGVQDARPLLDVYAWARGVHHTTIGLSGTQLQYPLMGLDLSNRVRYVHDSRAHGRAVYAIRNCPEWRDALAKLGARYVVVTPVRFPFNLRPGVPREAVWTGSIPGARRLPVGGGDVFVFSVTRLSRSSGCRPASPGA